MLIKKNFLILSEFDKTVFVYKLYQKSVTYSSVFERPMASFIIKFLSAHKAFKTFPWLPIPFPNHCMAGSEFGSSGPLVFSCVAIN